MPIVSLLVVVALLLLAGLIATQMAAHWQPLWDALMKGPARRMAARA